MLLIADTSVLINFLNVDRMVLISKHQPRCAITDHVLAEVTDFYPEQQEKLTDALARGYLDQTSITDDVEVELFARLQQSGRLGAGECSAMTVAVTRGYALAMDDRRAIRDTEVLAASENIAVEVLGTKDIVKRLIQAGALSVEQADVLLVTWRTKHRFSLNIKSFAELL